MQQCVSQHKAEDGAGRGRAAVDAEALWEHFELCCPDWRHRWNRAGNFGSSVYAYKLACTVLVRLDWWSVWGAWASSPVTGHFFGPPVWGDKCPRNSGKCSPSLLLKLYMYWCLVVQTLILVPLRFPVSGAMGGMFCLWSEAGGELNCLLCASFPWDWGLPFHIWNF